MFSSYTRSTIMNIEYFYHDVETNYHAMNSLRSYRRGELTWVNAFPKQDQCFQPMSAGVQIDRIIK